MSIQQSERRPLEANRLEREDEQAPRASGHCYDAEKCNAETFCDCPCRACTRTKRGEYERRG
jgi:hypothetical protein